MFDMLGEAGAKKARKEMRARGYAEEVIDSEIVADSLFDVLSEKGIIKEMSKETRVSVANMLRHLSDSIREMLSRLTGTETWRIELRDKATNYRHLSNMFMNAMDTAADDVQRAELVEDIRGEVRYSIKYTTDNKPVVVVTENILDGVPESEWVKTVKDTIRNKFPNGIPISGRLIKVNKVTRSEYTNSVYTKKQQRVNKAVYVDKFKVANNLDEIVLATTNYINEDLNHSRKDTFKEFARGDVLISVDGKNYSAKVIVGFTESKEMVLYDVISFQRASFTMKKRISRTVQHNAENSSTVISSDNTISQNKGIVNTIISENSENDSTKRYSFKKTLDMPWKEQVSGYYNKRNISRSDTLLVEKNTSERLQGEGLENVPFGIPLSVISKAQSGKDASHSISISNIKNLQSGIENYIACIYNADRKSVIFITNLTENGKPVVVSFLINQSFDWERMHKATSIHSRENIVPLLENLSEDSTVFVKNKKEFNRLVGLRKPDHRQALVLQAKIELNDSIVSQSPEKINPSEEKTFDKKQSKKKEPVKALKAEDVFGKDYKAEYAALKEETENIRKEIAVLSAEKHIDDGYKDEQTERLTQILENKEALLKRMDSLRTILAQLQARNANVSRYAKLFLDNFQAVKKTGSYRATGENWEIMKAVSEITDTYEPVVSDFATKAGLAKLQKEHKQIYDAFMAYARDKAYIRPFNLSEYKSVLEKLAKEYKAEGADISGLAAELKNAVEIYLNKAADKQPSYEALVREFDVILSDITEKSEKLADKSEWAQKIKGQTVKLVGDQYRNVIDTFGSLAEANRYMNGAVKFSLMLVFCTNTGVYRISRGL